MAKTVLAFVLTFAVCFLPHHVFMLWFYNYPKSTDEYNTFWHVLRIVGFCLTFINSCVNPIALYLVSGTFRKHFDRHLFRWCGTGPSTVAPTESNLFVIRKGGGGCAAVSRDARITESATLQMASAVGGRKTKSRGDGNGRPAGCSSWGRGDAERLSPPPSDSP